MRPILLIAGGLAVAAPLCRSSGQLVDTSLTKAALMARDAEVAARARSRGNSAFLEALGPNAAVLIPNQHILIGPAEAARPLEERYGHEGAYRWTAEHAVASTDGRFGCTVGTSRFVLRTDTTKTPRVGWVISCWRRDSAAQWWIVGHQRSDTQFDTTGAFIRFTDSLAAKNPLLPGPHSATVLRRGDAREEAIVTEIRYAQMGAAGTAGPMPAFVDYAAPDAILMPSRDVARGKTEVADAFKQWPATGVLEWEPDRRVGDGSGGLAFTVGNSRTYDRLMPDVIRRRGHFFSIWRQEPDGRWLWIFDLGSPRPPSADGR